MDGFDDTSAGYHRFDANVAAPRRSCLTHEEF